MQAAAQAGSPAFPVWSRAARILLSSRACLASLQERRRDTVLLDSGATHCFICARLAATLSGCLSGLPPSESAHPGRRAPPP